MTTYIANAFSLNMLDHNQPWDDIKILPCDIEYLPNTRLGWWAIGHADTSRVVAGLLGIDDPGPNRISVALEPGDTVIVAQYSGPRLSEGATELPTGARIQWWVVHV